MEHRQRIQENFLFGFQIGLSLTVCSVAILALAALGTFLLVLASRRATLRQVNASLALISNRLQQWSHDDDRPSSSGQLPQEVTHDS
jgi:hypothetical protein